jgi:bifunctional UDP-N-acetylglucosamine pyrophosphorylase/glucosamine-1-phosphate N-acetyltransferase
MNEATTVIVLAAGEGKRMRSALPKVMHPLLGRSLLGHVLSAAAPLRADRTLVVIGHGADQVAPHLTDVAPEATAVVQVEQHGTGHAVRVALDAAPDVTGTVIVLYGDTPLLRTETIADMLATHSAAGAAATVLAARVDDPTGLGRIIRDGGGRLDRIVEQRDASPDEAAVQEVNTGVCAFRADALREALGKLSTDNAQGEEYLTDVFGLLVAAGHPVEVHVAAAATETFGCNDRAQLADLRSLLRDRVNGDLMRSGVTLLDPATTWIDVTVTVDIDAVIEPNTQLRGATAIGAGALVGPDTTLTNVYVAAGAHVVRTHGSDAKIGPGASVGPFAYLRPGTDLGESAKIGTFVETKNATIGRGSKVPHLSYVGDATIGEQSNIGAATIFVNYDGVHKNHTTIGNAAFVGCDTNLIAPVTIGDGAYVAAGSAISKDVPPGALGVARGIQRNVEGWVGRKRAGTRSAEAAAKAIGARADDQAAN